MHLALLTFELLIPCPESIKDKRRVIKSVKDRLHREHLVSVAEVRYLDNLTVAGMALCLVNRDAKFARGVIDSIIDKLRSLPDAQLGDHFVEIISGGQLPTAFTGDDGTPLWTDDERREG